MAGRPDKAFLACFDGLVKPLGIIERVEENAMGPGRGGIKDRRVGDVRYGLHKKSATVKIRDVSLGFEACSGSRNSNHISTLIFNFLSFL